ncbi:ABC-type cobalamin/Fe3+-siderophores transport system component [Geoglobus ahangari]|uniref:ABC-type cobalamin/Fe3+-siderophores transport system component n=1 Tax=Geoglobus ahangari TaxID=113653 RepID=A0A0F7IEG0_9EURY|nr:ABC transporter ATP-binding protein [Geoglobus ahangari]AKG91359.1 ABC-type cobalamin/Fe3+-siderophores transport system component [Geoglobus ahangari]
MVAVEVRDVSFRYGSRSVLEGVSFSAEEGEVTAVIGPNGAGKTTLLKMVAGLERPTSGSVLLDGTDVREMGREEVTRIVSYLPQENVIPGIMTVYEVVLLGRIPYLTWRVKNRDLQVVDRVLAELGMESYAERLANQLSGGERQMVLIAQALVREPRVLLLDEPVSNLDIRNQLEILELVRRVTEERGVTTIVILHDLNLAARYADRLVVLNRGKVYASGAPREVLTTDLLPEVYGVEGRVEVGEHIHVLPVKPIKNGAR